MPIIALITLACAIVAEFMGSNKVAFVLAHCLNQTVTFMK